MNKQNKEWLQRRKRVSEIIEVGSSSDWVSRGYDVISSVVLLANLLVTILYTFNEMEARYGSALLLIEAVTVAFLQSITA